MTPTLLSFNLISFDCRYMKRSWSLIDQPNEIAIATNRVSSTLVGTLSNVLPRPFYALHRSTNKDDMFKYFQDLVKLLPRTTVKVTLVLDNHSVSHQCLLLRIKHSHLQFVADGRNQVSNSEVTLWDSPTFHQDIQYCRQL